MKNFIVVIFALLLTTASAFGQSVPTKKEVRKEYKELTHYFKEVKGKEVPIEQVPFMTVRAANLNDNLYLGYSEKRKHQVALNLLLLTQDFVIEQVNFTLQETIEILNELEKKTE